MNYFTNMTIVVPFDFSEVAEKAVDKALELAGDSASIHIIHVVEPTPVIISIDPSLPVPPTFDHERREQALSSLQHSFSQEKDPRFNVQCMIGDPGSEISNYAQSVDADLIMMPSHGRTGLKRLFLGSVAERVLRLSHRPVLILREPA